MMSLQVEELLDQACQVTGLDDFGDPSFRVGLEKLVDSINRNAEPTEVGKVAIPGSIVGNLINRLRIEECYREHPEIDDQDIRDPVFITGLPRTGSTALGHMLALDAETRSLRGWEAAEPCPPPDINVPDDPRIERNIQRGHEFEALVPGVTEAMPRNAHAPEECFYLLDLSFADVAFNGFHRIPEYERWAMTEGLPEVDAAYRYHRRVLKLLQWKTPARRWVLRSPVHSAYMGALLKSYPDARFVVTHRDPVKVLPSICSLIYQVREAFLQNPGPRELGAGQMDQWQEAMRRLIRNRDSLGEERFFDLYHREQVADPEPGLRRLYHWLGWEFSEQFHTRLEQWRAENPKGTHKSDLADFGLEADEIKDRFAFYTDRFGERM